MTTPLLLLLAACGERRLGVAVRNAGADDFILPPLTMAEFVARARALPVMENPNMFFLRKNLVFGFSFLILRSER